jgi:formylmethanofuran dehydrogenase subunit B
MPLNIISNATCTFCGCVCDDIEIHADDVKIHEAKKACVLGKAWFLNHNIDDSYPAALIDGEPASLDDAIEAAATYLFEANLPLVYGLSNTTCEAQREAAELADRIGGLLDSHTSL